MTSPGFPHACAFPAERKHKRTKSKKPHEPVSARCFACICEETAMPLCEKCEVRLPGKLDNSSRVHPAVPVDGDEREQEALDVKGLENEAEVDQILP